MRTSRTWRVAGALPPEEDGILKDVHFAYDSYELDGGARDALTRNVDWLRQNSRARIEVEGHCDSRGTIEYNLALGAKRAKTVKDYLMAQGISAERVSTISYGKELPLCHEENDTCWARNRRAHSVALAGCATRAELVQQDHQLRTILQDQRRQLQEVQKEVERLRADIEEGHPRRSGGGGASEDRLAALEQRLAELEG